MLLNLAVRLHYLCGATNSLFKTPNEGGIRQKKFKTVVDTKKKMNKSYGSPKLSPAT
jgi:hypothetical protein